MKSEVNESIIKNLITLYDKTMHTITNFKFSKYFKA
jgi:hypothetical protein